MKILVCVGNVPDTTTKVKFVDNKLDVSNIQWIINPWDELALTRALELKEDAGNSISNVSIATVGLVGVEATMRKGLAIGADDAFRIDADPKDAYFVAKQLATIVEQEKFDIVLAGIESSDYNGSAVGSMLAGMLHIPMVSSVSGLNANGETIAITRELDGGKEVVSVSLPSVLVVQKGIAINPRIPAMRGIMMARTKPLKVMPAVDCEALTEIVDFELPKAKSACKMVAADNVAQLVELLRNEAKVI
jgi:electron transfer flavoprotein beta subunit